MKGGNAGVERVSTPVYAPSNAPFGPGPFTLRQAFIGLVEHIELADQLALGEVGLASAV